MHHSASDSADLFDTGATDPDEGGPLQVTLAVTVAVLVLVVVFLLCVTVSVLWACKHWYLCSSSEGTCVLCYGGNVPVRRAIVPGFTMFLWLRSHRSCGKKSDNVVEAHSESLSN